MNRFKCVYFFVAVAIAAGLLISRDARAEGSQARAEQRLRELHSWLDGSEFGPAWRSFLKSDLLAAELAAGADADPRIVSEVLEQYSSAAAGLDRRRFVAVRDALQDWLTNLTQTDLADLPQLAREAKEHFRPANEKELNRKKAALETSTQQLDRVLTRAGATKRRGWQKYLQWESLQTALTADTPDLRALRLIELKFFALHKGLELVPFDSVRQRLRSYTNALIVADPRTAEFYQRQLDALATHLQDYADQPDSKTALGIGRILGWLESAGQARWVVSGVRGQFWRPNLHAHVSQRLIAAGFQEEVVDTRPINEFIMGTSITGEATTVARISVDFIPSANRAAFDFKLSGVARSKNVGVHGPVAVYSSGTSRIAGSTRIFVDETGFSALPAAAHVTTSTSIDGVAARFRFNENIAWRKAHQQKGTAEAIGSSRTEDRLRVQMNGQVDEILAKLNNTFVEKFRKPLLRKDHFPQQATFQYQTRAARCDWSAGRLVSGRRRQPRPRADGRSRRLGSRSRVAAGQSLRRPDRRRNPRQRQARRVSRGIYWRGAGRVAGGR